MTRKIALITGASKGLGRAMTIAAASSFPELDELWLVSRNIQIHESLAAACGGRELRAIALDLCDPASFGALQEQLSNGETQIVLLVNNAGCGFLGNVADNSAAQIASMIDLNVRALSLVTNLALPYMPDGSKIISISSIAAFCPTSRMSVYGATKAYVSAFSRGLYEELRPRHISVTTVCPGPMATDFLVSGKIQGNSKTFAALPYCDPQKVAAGAIRAAKRGKPFYTPTGFYKIYRFLSKIFPWNWMVKLAKI